MKHKWIEQGQTISSRRRRVFAILSASRKMERSGGGGGNKEGTGARVQVSWLSAENRQGKPKHHQSAIHLRTVNNHPPQPRAMDGHVRR